MKSFFDKLKITKIKGHFYKVIDSNYIITYFKNEDYETYSLIDDIYIIKTKSLHYILNNTKNIIINCTKIDNFPNNVNNPNLEIIFRNYKNERLPENWSIKKIDGYTYNNYHNPVKLNVNELNKPESFNVLTT